MAGTVSRGAGALHRRTVAEILHVAAERTLIDAAVFGTRERHTIVLELIDSCRSFARKIFHRVDVAEPVRTLDGVVKVPLPIVRPHVLQRGGNTALGRHGVRAGREHLGDAGGLETLLSHAQRCAQTGTTGAHDDDIELMVNISVGFSSDAGP